MKTRAFWGLAALTAALVVGACQDVTKTVAPEEPAQPTLAGNDTPCAGPLTGMFDNVIVPPGETCTLSNSLVTGNVKALEDSRLVMINNDVRGNVIGEKADVVRMVDNTVGGSISIKEGGPGGGVEVLLLENALTNGNLEVEKMIGSIEVDHNTVNGNIKVADNLSPGGQRFAIRANNATENIQVFKNRGPDPLVRFVIENIVGEDLQCFDNDLPFIGGPNVAQKAEGQCF